MKTNIIFILISITSLIACKKETTNQPTTSTETIETSRLEDLNIQMNSFSEIDSSGILMFPLNMGENENEEHSRSYKSIPDQSYWNIVFYNSKTNAYHLLTDQKMIILDYDFKNGNQRGIETSSATNHIFYEVRNNDFNKDKLINEDDPITLFASDKFGRNFRQISPQNTSLNRWEYIPASNKIIMTVTKDSDKNKAFDEEDEIATYTIVLNQNEKPKEVFNKAFKDELKQLFDRDWKKIK